MKKLLKFINWLKLFIIVGFLVFLYFIFFKTEENLHPWVIGVVIVAIVLWFCLERIETKLHKKMKNSS